MIGTDLRTGTRIAPHQARPQDGGLVSPVFASSAIGVEVVLLPCQDRGCHRFDVISAEDAVAVLGRARALRECAEMGLADVPLTGKNIGLLARDRESDEAKLFLAAASKLGARVAAIRVDRTIGTAERQQTARLLGQLYDALECQGLSQVFVEETRAHAGIPVFAGLASPTHPVAELATCLEDGTRETDGRLYVLMAALVVALA